MFSAMPAALRDRCGNGALMTRVVDLLCDYTSKTWAPQAVQEIDHQISTQQRLLESLGMAPTDTRLPQAALDVAVQLVEHAVSRTEVGACPWPPFPRLEGVNYPLVAMPTIAATRICNANKTAAEKWLRDNLMRSNSTISSAVLAELRNHRVLPTALHRFHKLRTEIGTMLQRSVDRSHARVCSLDNIGRKFEAMTAALEATNQESTLERATSKLARALQNEASIDAMDQFLGDLPKVFSIAGIFSEDNATSQKRRELTQLIAELTEVRGLVESLSKDDGTASTSRSTGASMEISMYDHECVGLGAEVTIRLRVRNVGSGAYGGGRLVMRPNGYFSMSSVSVPAIASDREVTVSLHARITGSKAYKDVPSMFEFELDGRCVAIYESRPGSLLAALLMAVVCPPALR